MNLLIILIVLFAFAYQYFDELQDRSVNSDWQGNDFWASFFKLQFLNKVPYGWKRKWKNGDPKQGPAFFLANGPLVFLTDGEHLFQLFKQLCMINCLAIVTGLLTGNGLLATAVGLAFAAGLLAMGYSKRFTNLR